MSAANVRGIVDALEPYPFGRIYGGWWGTIVAKDAKEAVRRSAQRYIQRIMEEV